MGWWKKHHKQLPGQPIAARTLRTLAETADFTSRIQAFPPLGIIAGFNGPILRYEGEVFDAFIGVTTSTITARSGGTPGSGTAKVQTWDGTSLADLSGPITFTVYNWSSATGGISSSKYCICMRIAGDYWVIAAEC